MVESFPIILRLQGGLGNQLYQYATGVGVANSLGRPLLLDARTIQPEAPLRQYGLDAFGVQEKFVAGLPSFCTRWLGSVRLGAFFKTVFLPARNYKYIRDCEEGFDPRVFEPHNGPIVLHGYWQSYRYFEGIEDSLRKDFHFRNAPDRRNEKFIEKISSKESICVHVRRGDYVSNPAFAENLGVCDIDYYQRAVWFLAERTDAPEFFVFSDDPEWARANLQFPGATVVIAHNLGGSDAEDLRLMTHCKHFVIANSSFSWWGAWLATNPGKMVIAPARWFNRDMTPAADRIPQEWIRL